MSYSRRKRQLNERGCTLVEYALLLAFLGFTALVLTSAPLGQVQGLSLSVQYSFYSSAHKLNVARISGGGTVGSGPKIPPPPPPY